MRGIVPDKVYQHDVNYVYKGLFVFLDEPSSEIGVSDDGFYPSGSPYRVQRHAANIRERKRMLRCVENFH